jgi:hypothetical protein
MYRRYIKNAALVIYDFLCVVPTNKKKKTELKKPRD